MRFLVSLCLVVAVVFLLANNQALISGKSIVKTDSLPPVESRPANSEYKPAFAGQTRVAGAKTTTAYKVEKIGEKLGRPWAITLLPDGRFMLTDKSGFMAIHSADGALVKKVTGFPAVDDRGQ